MDSVSRVAPPRQLCVPKFMLGADRTVIELAAAARIYATIGWYVFPLPAFSKRPRRHSHGLLEATRDIETIARWWDEDPGANIGVNCGMSGLIVIDVDPRNGGDDALAAWMKVHGGLPDTLVAHTPSGGLHYYYAAPNEWHGRKGKLCQGVDIQAAGGYVIVPPSETLQGEYRWAVCL